MSDTHAEDLAWLMKIGQVRDQKEAAKPTTTETEEN